MFHQGLCGIAWPFHVFWPLPLAKELLTIRPPVGISEVSRVPEKKKFRASEMINLKNV